MKFVIRRASEADVPAIVQILRRTRRGQQPDLGVRHVRSWLQVHPAGLLVAQLEACVVAFVHIQILAFDPAVPFPLQSHGAMTDDGTTCATHTPHGNAYSAVADGALTAEAGAFLRNNAFSATGDLGLPYIVATSRISGLARYVDAATRRGLLPADRSADLMEQVALFYGRAYAQKTGAPVSPGVPLPRPLLAARLPPPEERELALEQYLRMGFVLHGVLPGFAPDFGSRDFGVVLYKEVERARWLPQALRAAAPSAAHISGRGGQALA